MLSRYATIHNPQPNWELEYDLGFVTLWTVSVHCNQYSCCSKKSFVLKHVPWPWISRLMLAHHLVLIWCQSTVERDNWFWNLSAHLEKNLEFVVIWPSFSYLLWVVTLHLSCLIFVDWWEDLIGTYFISYPLPLSFLDGMITHYQQTLAHLYWGHPSFDSCKNN